ncbi:hypothetical protein NPIL_513621 [Nephila pilipes]|uniref:Uncharacterized protein n=1 Tax=Nephila pilipes TaxID=299642 RepID=A0A8X6TW30_NEPPI|nr:hypothetical protein NPIL_513621 [Nephila pilipes]
MQDTLGACRSKFFSCINYFPTVVVYPPLFILNAGDKQEIAVLEKTEKLHRAKIMSLTFLMFDGEIGFHKPQYLHVPIHLSCLKSLLREMIMINVKKNISVLGNSSQIQTFFLFE